MSVTVQTTRLVPTAYGSLPLLTTVATAQLSLVLDGVPRLTLVALHWPRSAFTMTVAGQVMLGGWLSTTMTCWVQVLWLLCMSVTVQTTRLVPTAYGSVPLLTTVATPQLSLVETGTPSTILVALHWPRSAFTVTVVAQ